MANLFNLARCFVASTGTGPLTIGSAVPGYLTFAVAGATAGMTLSYAIRDGANSEIGHGVYNGTTLTRNVTKSTASDTPINVTANAQVFLTPTAEDMSGAVGAWRFWKLRNIWPGDPTNAVTISSLQLRASVGGSGQTPSAVSVSSGSGNPVTGTWTSASRQTVNGSFGSFTLGDSDPWVLLDMGTAKSVAEISLNGAGSSARSNLVSFEVWVSADNATWFLVSGFDANGGTQTFTMPAVVLGGMAINTSGGGGGGGATTLNALTDVNVTEGVGIDGYTLNWNNSTGKWIATAPVTGGGGASALTGLSDVNVVEGSSINKNVLAYDNGTSKWRSATALGVVIGDGSHRYWKVVLHNPGAFLGLSEMKLEVTAGAGTPSDVTYSSDSTPTAPPQWYDGDETHYVECSNPGVTNSVTADVIFTFTTAHIISNLRLHTAQSFGLDVPDSYAVYYSDNGTTWTLAASAALSGLALDTTYNYTIPLTITPATLANIGLPDFPTSYSGKALQVLRVNSAANAVEFHSLLLSDLADVNVTDGSTANTYVLTWDTATSKWIAAAGGGGGGGGGLGLGAAEGEMSWVAPTTSTFTFRGSTANGKGTGTIANLSNSRGVRISAPLIKSANTNGNSYATIPVPTGGAHSGWIATARLRRHMPLYNWGMTGMVIIDSASTKMRTLGLGNDSVIGFNFNNWSGPDTWAAVAAGGPSYDRNWWQRIFYNGTNILWQVSADGEAWETLMTESPTTYLPVAPTNVGIFVNPNFGNNSGGSGNLTDGNPCDFDILSWSAVSY